MTHKIVTWQSGCSINCVASLAGAMKYLPHDKQKVIENKSVHSDMKDINLLCQLFNCQSVIRFNLTVAAEHLK